MLRFIEFLRCRSPVCLRIFMFLYTALVVVVSTSVCGGGFFLFCETPSGQGSGFILEDLRNLFSPLFCSDDLPSCVWYLCLLLCPVIVKVTKVLSESGFNRSTRNSYIYIQYTDEEEIQEVRIIGEMGSCPTHSLRWNVWYFQSRTSYCGIRKYILKRSRVLDLP